jgi:hypothetical protein
VHLLPGQAAAVRAHYAYATDVAGGRHESVVLLRVRGGKAVRLLMRGATLPPHAPFLYSGLPDRVARLAPVPIGVGEPPVQTLVLRNVSAVPLRFTVLPDALDAAASAAYGARIWTVLDESAFVAPGEEAHVRVRFAPVEARAYAVRVVFAYERAGGGGWDAGACAARAREAIGAARSAPPADEAAVTAAAFLESAAAGEFPTGTGVESGCVVARGAAVRGRGGIGNNPSRPPTPPGRTQTDPHLPPQFD